MKYWIKAWIGLTVDERQALCLVLALLLLGLAAKYCLAPPLVTNSLPSAPVTVRSPQPD